jgi:hypothetical protein
VTIATYTDLQAAIGNWLARTDLTTFIPDLIALAEQRIYYGAGDDVPPLRIRAMEQYTDPTTFLTTLGAQTLALPAGYLGQTANRTIYVNSSPVSELEFVTAKQLDTRYSFSGNAQPRAYSIQGENLLFGPPPDAAYGIKLGYYKKPDPLSLTATNAVLTAFPAIYLYSALIESAPFVRADARMATWAAMYAAAVKGAMAADDLDRWGGLLTGRPDGSTP